MIGDFNAAPGLRPRMSVVEPTPAPRGDPKASAQESARSLAALGRFLTLQGRPRQGLALLLSAQRLDPNAPALTRNIAYALVAAGASGRALPLIERLVAEASLPHERRAALHLKSRALLALGRTEEARAVFAARRDTPKALS